MTPTELYNLLDAHDVDYELVEIFEGARFLRVVVEETNAEGDTE